MTSNSPDNTSEVVIPRGRDEQGQRVYRTNLTAASDNRPKVLLASRPAPLPVVFLPGIMGSNLRNKESKEIVWRPPNASLAPRDVLGAIGALFTWWRRGPKKRQKLLNPDQVEVDDSGSIDPGKSGLSKEAARFRGWGTVMRSSYNPIMAVLEQRLDNILKLGELEPWWSDEALASPSDYGEELGQAQPLNKEELEYAAAYQFDVWCCGYNWLRSNRDSAQAVRDFIENTVLPHYRDSGQTTAEQMQKMKVILVTHSMGGLVSRSLTQLLGYDRVLGVVHGVQPATGAPAIYHHMRCGYEGIERIVLGANAGEVTAVVANSPGALELTPSAVHRDGKPWLFLRDEQGNISRDKNGKPRAYPQNRDPYDEIYKSPDWYGLVPKQNERYLDMSNKKMDNPKYDLRSKFSRSIEMVRGFHTDLASCSYHSETYSHYGAEASEARHSWRDINWKGNISALEQPNAEVKDNGRGKYKGTISTKLAPTNPLWPGHEKIDTGGDGTVPTDSGQAPSRAGIKASFRHGNLGKGLKNIEPGYDHQSSYNDDRARWATLYSIAKLAQNADWHSENP